jgi:hypothetical protein
MARREKKERRDDGLINAEIPTIATSGHESREDVVSRISYSASDYGYKFQKQGNGRPNRTLDLARFGDGIQQGYEFGGFLSEEYGRDAVHIQELADHCQHNRTYDLIHDIETVGFSDSV